MDDINALREAVSAYFSANQSQIEAQIEKIVSLESPTSDPVACDAVAAFIESELSALGAQLQEIVDLPAGHARPVIASFGEQPSVALVFHHDTVWPVGSFPEPRRDGPSWYAPGIFDMKANLIVMLHVLKFWKQQDPNVLAKLRYMSSPDEEIMGYISRTYMTRAAQGCEWALVYEPPRPDGSFKWQRKGLARLTVQFQGIATHTGNHYTEGVSALAAASRWLLEAESLSQPERGLTVNVGILQGGSAVNTRPARAVAQVDVRFDQVDDWHELRPRLQALGQNERFVPQLSVEVEVPPLDAKHDGWQLLQQICEALDQPFGLGKAGGGSDGSNIAQLGVKVMDGMGLAGAGEHAENEHILMSALPGCFMRNAILLKML